MSRRQAAVRRARARLALAAAARPGRLHISIGVHLLYGGVTYPIAGCIFQLEDEQ
ncbi:MAG TPA: hypothetical protein VH637_00160 [Streptosporangiaceae bacterium]